MKRIKKSVFIVLLVLVSFLTVQTVVQASQALTVAGDNEVISEDVDGVLLITGNNITVDGDVNGIIMGSGSQVTVNGQVSGPAFLAGNGVTFNGQAEDLFMAGNTVEIGPDAEVTRDAFLAGSTLSVHSNVGRDLFAGSNSLNLSSEVGRDAYLGLSPDGIHISDEGRIRGDLSYTSDQRNQEVEEKVDGEVSFTQQSTRAAEPSQQSKVITFLWKMVGAVLSAWLIWWIANRLANYRWMLLREDTRNIWVTMGIGLAALIVWPILAVLAMITTVLVLPGAILLALYFMLILLGLTMLAAMIEQNFLSQRFSNIKYPRVLAFLTSFLVLYLLTQLPYVGWIVGLLAVIYALGSGVRDFFYFMRVPEQTR